MANMCSRHQGHVKDCELCNTHPRDALRDDVEKMFPDWDEKVREAEKAGLTTCKECSFEYYLTINFCPFCGANDATETDQTD